MKFRLVDYIVEWQPRRICGVKAVSFEEYMLRAPLGYGEQLPESLLLGSMVELASWLTILSSGFTQIGMPCELGEVRFSSAVGPGQQVRMALRVCEQTDQGSAMEGVGHVGDRETLRVTGMRLKAYPLSEYCDAADLRVLFSEIHRPVRAGVTT